jgi:UDPglucose 6-dehydrogenase
MDRMNVGVYGVGFVGGATADVLEQAHNVHRYDKYRVPFNNSGNLEKLAIKSEVVFFCLPTPMQQNDEIDYGPMHDSFKAFTGELDRIGRPRDSVLGVIRSTAVSGTTDMFADQYGLRLTFNPEFLTERNALQDMKNTERVVIGAHTAADGELVKRVYEAIFPKARYHLVSPRTAEMVKYAANVALASKVAIANEIFDVCEALGVDYNVVKPIILEDSRIGGMMDVPGFDGYRGFGGKCFPKDLNALRAASRKAGFNPWLLDAVWRKNLEVREKSDWLDIPGAVSENNNFSSGSNK